MKRPGFGVLSPKRLVPKNGVQRSGKKGLLEEPTIEVKNEIESPSCKHRQFQPSPVSFISTFFVYKFVFFSHARFLTFQGV